MRVVFMGTPDFAALHLQALVKGQHQVWGVYTQPDRPKGRGKQLGFSPVKLAAQARGLPIRQAARLADPGEVAWLRGARPDAIVVVAYGQKIPAEILSLPLHGCINIHASLLPKYRGAAPIQWAILCGERETGVTSMRMDEGWDTGDILLQERVPIDSETDAGSLHDRLAEAGTELLLKTLVGLETGATRPLKQDGELAGYAPKLHKADGIIDWHTTAPDIERKVRALRPWPGAFTFWDGVPLRIWRAEVESDPERRRDASVADALEATGTEAARRELHPNGAPGTVLSVGRHTGGVSVQTGRGALRLVDVQPASRRRVTALDFAHGARIRAGDAFEGAAPGSGDDTASGESRA